MRWIPYVMVRITAFFVAGVLLGIYLPSRFPLRDATVFLTIFAAIYLVIRLLLLRTAILRAASGFLGLMIIFLSGYLCVLLRNESQCENSLVNSHETILGYRMKVVSGAERRERSWRMVGRIEAVHLPTGWKPCDNQLMLYWPLTERPDTLNYGDILVVKGSPQQIEGPQNPNEFDYRRFLARRNIYHRHFLRPGTWKLLHEGQVRGPAYYAVKARTWTIGVIEGYVDGDREQAIVNAFVIGVTEGIDDELKQAYAAGGAMHALAVSGIHVSILYGVMLFLLRPLTKRRAGPWVIAVISLLVLWMYAFITGLSPSVLRAVTMFSFVAIAKPIGRTTSIVNTLAASAFFLLLYDPYLILSAGFQLSYLAVLGIVLLYRPIYNLWEHRWAWSDWVWQISCVSMAAQLATLPVTLYYFHQFPVYFLLSNLFVVPGAAIILLSGILLLLISPISFLATWLGKLISFFVFSLNEGLFLVERLPSSLIAPISVTLLQAFCLAGLVVTVYMLFQSRKFYWTLILIGLAMVISIENWLNQSDDAGQFVVYRVANKGIMDWIDRRQVLTLMDSTLHADTGALQFHVIPNRLTRRVDCVQITNHDQVRSTALVVFRGQRFLFIRSKSYVTLSGQEANYIIVGHNAVPSLETLIQNIKFDTLILDSSNSLRYCERLKTEAALLGIPCFAVLTDGAFTLNL